MKVEVAVLGSPSLISPVVSCGHKATFEEDEDEWMLYNELLLHDSLISPVVSCGRKATFQEDEDEWMLYNELLLHDSN